MLVLFLLQAAHLLVGVLHCQVVTSRAGGALFEQAADRPMRVCYQLLKHGHQLPIVFDGRAAGCLALAAVQ
jgi:hypothetical protein